MGDALWEDCFATLDSTPLPPPNRSLFDNDLFCYENELPTNTIPDLDNFPTINPLPLIDSDTIPSNPSTSTNAPVHSPTSYPPSILTPAPRALSPNLPKSLPNPIEDEDDGFLHIPQWRSFLDDHCPLRKRVKITVAKDVREKRPAPSHVFSSPPPAKKMRFCTPPSPPPLPPTIDIVTPPPAHINDSSAATTPSSTRRRRLQTTLRFPRPGEMVTGRLMLDIPSPIRENSPLLLLSDEEDEDMGRGAGVKSLPPVAECEETPFGQDTTAYPSENEMYAGAVAEEGGVVMTVDGNAEMVLRGNRTSAPAACVISSDLLARLSNVKERRVREGVKENILPRVDAAVVAVTKAAKAYSESLRMKGVVEKRERREYVKDEVLLPPPPPLPPRLLCGSTVVQKRMKRKKGKRKRVLLSFDDREVKPLAMPEGFGDEGMTPLQRYLLASGPVNDGRRIVTTTAAAH